MTQTGSHQIVFQLKHWEGDYWSNDVPGGVAVAPNRNTLYLVNGDGRGLRPLDLAVSNPQNPHFSPDGQWLYFQSNARGHWHIYRCRPDGAQAQNLTEDHKLGSDSFGIEMARDGRHLLFTSNHDKIGRVAIMDADGANARIIVPDIGYHYMASFSPDGQRIVFSHTADGYRIKVMDLDGKNLTVLTPEHPDSYCARFAPDGSTILFIRKDGDIYRINPDGTNLTRLTTGNGYVEFKLTPDDRHGSSDPPDISPDGTRLAYLAVKDGSAQVHTMNCDGSEQRQITHLPNRCGRARWSPDGRQIAFVSFVRESKPQLFVMPAEGGDAQQLAELDGAVYVLARKRIG